MYTVIGSPKTRTMRVIWMLEELGEPYEINPVPPRGDAARAFNPMAKVPSLQGPEGTISDSVAILTYLADKHGKLTYPAGTVERAQQDALTHTALDELDAVLWTAARHSFVLPEEQRVPQVKDSLKWEFARNAERLAERIEGPFLMGDRMTIADIITAHCLNWAYGAKFPVEDERLLNYAKAMRGREAFKRAAGK